MSACHCEGRRKRLGSVAQSIAASFIQSLVLSAEPSQPSSICCNYLEYCEKSLLLASSNLLAQSSRSKDQRRQNLADRAEFYQARTSIPSQSRINTHISCQLVLHKLYTINKHRRHLRTTTASPSNGPNNRLRTIPFFPLLPKLPLTIQPSSPA